jgi:hypothetical protein
MRRGEVEIVSHLFSLPKGCINELTGEVEDPSFIVSFFKSIQLQERLRASSLLSLKPDISLILPAAVCYHVNIPIDEGDRILDTPALLRKYSRSLPGDVTKLILSGYASAKDLAVKANGELSVFAARERAVRGYIRLFEEHLVQVVSVLPPQVARYNRILHEFPASASGRILNIHIAPYGGEISLWDCGVMISSESRAESMQRYHREGSKGVAVEFIAEHPEAVEREVLRFLEKAEIRGRNPSEVFITGEPPRSADLSKILRSRLLVPVRLAKAQGDLLGYKSSIARNQIAAEDTEAFADLLGVIRPKYREINLLPQAIRERRIALARASRLARPLVCALGCALIGLSLSIISIVFSCRGVNDAILRVDERIAQLRGSLKARQGELKGLLDAEKINAGECRLVAHSLARVGEIVPEAMTVSSLVVDRRQWVITGVARDRGQVSEFVERIGNRVNRAEVDGPAHSTVTLERLGLVDVEGMSLQEFVLRAVF